MNSKHSRGFFTMELVLALAAALVLLMVFTFTISRQAKAERQLAASRTANRAAEAALLALQSGQPLPPGAAVQRLNAAADTIPEGFAWIRLSLPARDDRPAASLVGLVPLNHLPSQGGRP